jgi:hypothetical protein
MVGQTHRRRNETWNFGESRDQNVDRGTFLVQCVYHETWEHECSILPTQEPAIVESAKYGTIWWSVRIVM